MNPRDPAQSRSKTAAPNPRPLAIIARAAADARHVWTAASGPVALLLDPLDGRVISIGPAAALDLRTADMVEHPNSVLIPGLANAHAHLDLTDVGPRPHDPSRGFMPWIDMVRRERPTEDAAIAAAVRRGIDLSLAGGTAAIGDIAGAPRAIPSTMPFDILTDAPIVSVSYLEFFAIGNGQDRGVGAISSAVSSLESRRLSHVAGARIGLQPHAPNTVALAGYEHALSLAAPPRTLPVCTHLAESPEEREFIAHAHGPQRDLLESLGLWNDDLARTIGHRRSPVEHLAPVLEAAATQGTSLTAVHCNDVTDADLDILTRTGTCVVYCPRASDYFGAPSRLGPHRYRQMLARRIPVALGTDSIINLPRSTVAPGSGGGRISILDEMRFLFARDQTDPATLLHMATLGGAHALHLSPVAFQICPDARPHAILAIDVSPCSSTLSPLESILTAETPPMFAWTRKSTV